MKASIEGVSISQRDSIATPLDVCWPRSRPHVRHGLTVRGMHPSMLFRRTMLALTMNSPDPLVRSSPA